MVEAAPNSSGDPKPERKIPRWLLILGVLLVALFAFYTWSRGSGFEPTRVALPTATTVPQLPAVLLTDRGIESVVFGDPVESLHTLLTSLLGPPASDSIQTCIDGQETGRWIRWGDLSTMSEDGGFRTFIHGPFFPAVRNPTHIPAHTADGLLLGMTVSDLLAAYPERVSFEEPYTSPEGDEIRAFGIDGYDFYSSPSGIGGYLKGDLETGTVITIVGGLRCPTLRDLRPT